MSEGIGAYTRLLNFEILVEPSFSPRRDSDTLLGGGWNRIVSGCSIDLCSTSTLKIKLPVIRETSAVTR